MKIWIDYIGGHYFAGPDDKQRGDFTAPDAVVNCSRLVWWLYCIHVEVGSLFQRWLRRLDDKQLEEIDEIPF